MNSNWYYSDGLQTYGPVPAEQLIAMIQAGQVQEAHLVLLEGTQEWQAVTASPFAALVAPMAVLVMDAVEVPRARIQIRLSDIEHEIVAPWHEHLPIRKLAIAAAVLLITLFAYSLRPFPEQNEVLRLEGESLQAIQATAGSTEIQDMTASPAAVWSSGKQLHWVNDTLDATLIIALPVATRTKARLRALMTLSSDYGTLEVSLDGEPVFGSPFNLHNYSTTLTGILDWGVHDLTAGSHEISLKATRSEAPKGFHAGIDLLLLEPPLRTGPPVPVETNLASMARASASHCWRDDKVIAINDGKEPSSGRSSDTSIPRHTFWDRRGGQEWVQYEWETPQVVQECSVFWWEDASRGGATPVPYFWRILYRENSGAWVPVNTTIPAAKADQWNVVKFPPVRTRALRLAVQCVMGKTVGILEWKAMAGKADDIKPGKQSLPDLFLGDLTPLYARVGWYSYRVSQYHEADVNGGNVLRFDSKDAEYYLWAHVPSRLEFAIPSGYTQFRATAFGPFNVRTNTRSHGAWEYEVRVDNRIIYTSRMLETYRNHETIIGIDLPPNSRRLTLITKSDDASADHAFWGNPRFTMGVHGTPLPATLVGKATPTP